MSLFKLGATVLTTIIKCVSKDEIVTNIVEGTISVAGLLNDSFEDRRYTRTLEDMSDNISESCNKILANTKITPERQKVILELIIDAVNHTELSYQKLFEYNFNIDLIFKELSNNIHIKPFDLDTNEKENLDRLLLHISTLIVKYIMDCPDFTNQGIRDIIIEITDLKDKFKMILDELKKVNEVVANKTETTKKFEESYRNNIINKCDWVRLFGADNLNGLEKPYRLSIAYVTLEMSNATSYDTKLDIKNIFKDENVVWITGEAGSGKTTFLQWLAVKSASNTDVGIKELEQTVPIFMPLRSLNCKNLSLKESIGKIMSNSSLNMPESWLDDLLDFGNILLLVDGIDEVKENEQSSVFEWIEELYRLYPKIKIVITARPQIEERVTIKHSEISILPMTRKKVECFIDYWHKSVLEERLQLDADDINSCKNKLLYQLDTNDSIRLMSTNPLLCAMICALNYKNGTIIAKERNSLYEDCCRMLLDKRDVERNIDVCKNIHFNYEEKKTILSKLAYWMMKNNYSSANIADVSRCIERTLKSLRDEYSNYSSNEVLEYLLLRSGILRSPNKNEIDFIHKSFLEYLAAYEISREEDWGFIQQKANNLAWYNTLILTMGFAGQKRATDIITSIMQNASNKKQLIIAAACANNATSISNELRSSISDKLSKIMPPKTNEDIKQLSNAGEFAVPFLSFNNQYSKDENCNCLKVLQAIYSSKTLSQVATFVNDAISEEECGIIANILSEYTLDEIKESGIDNKISNLIKNNIYSKKLKIPEKFLTILNSDNIDGISSQLETVEELILTNYFGDDNEYPYKKFTNLHNLTILGEINNLPILSVINSQLEKLTICDTKGDFDLYSLNQYKEIKTNKFAFHSSCSLFFNGNDIPFLYEVEELELNIYTTDAEIVFTDFYNFKNLKKLTIMSYINMEYDYSPLNSLNKLENLILKMPSSCEEWYYNAIDASLVRKNLKFSVEPFEYPFGKLEG